MRYVRFLKTPRVVVDEKTSKKSIRCLITVTSDLGDFFFPHDVGLAAELISSQKPEKVLAWQVVDWKAGLRSIPISFPLVKPCNGSKLRIRVGTSRHSSQDDYTSLVEEEESHGILSAWSAEFFPQPDLQEAMKLVERRIGLTKDCNISIWEETGESIARHVWDAGIVLSCHVYQLLNEKSEFSRALLPSSSGSRLRILELGTGCGIVGLCLATLLGNTEVILTDLLEAREIVERNIDCASFAASSSAFFRELNWDEQLPTDSRIKSKPLNLVIAADCTYNSDSSPALVNTLARLANTSPNLTIAIAMKMRHSSEAVFFDLMADARFEEVFTRSFPLPGVAGVGEETVRLHVYNRSVT